MSKRNSIAVQFAARTIEMLEAPAYRVLSLAAHRVMDRIHIELGHHGGHDNGKLPVTYNDFVEYGIHRHAIGPAIRELVALGFVEVTEQGRAGNAEFRSPNKFRLNYAYALNMKPTDEWKRIQSLEEAEAIAVTSRAGKSAANGSRNPSYTSRVSCQQ